MSKKELSPLFQLRNYILKLWRGDKKYFLGRVLTIIDASIADPKQRKGIKDLIQEAHWGEHRSYRQDEMRRILWRFKEKFLPDETDDEAGFMGVMEGPKEGVAEPDYFTE